MATRIDLTPFAPFDTLSDPISLGKRWKTWKRWFETYIVALNITDNTQKRAVLLYQAGEATRYIFDTLQITGNPDDYTTAIAKLDQYFQPKKNVDYEIFQFRSTKQQNHDETIDQFATRLRKLASTCELNDVDR